MARAECKHEAIDCPIISDWVLARLGLQHRAAYRLDSPASDAVLLQCQWPRPHLRTGLGLNGVEFGRMCLNLGFFALALE
jgi:hypothetical protein